MAKGKKEVRFQQRPVGLNGHGTRDGSESVSPVSSDGTVERRSSMSKSAHAKELVSGVAVRAELSSMVADPLVGAAGNARSRLRKEETKLHHPNNMDIHHDFSLLRGDIRGPHLHDHDRDWRSNSLFQGGHCDIERTQPRPQSALH